MAEPPQPPPNDEELRWKSRQRSSFPNDSDLETASDDDGQPDFARRLSLYHSDYGRTYAPYDASEVVPPPDGVQSSDLTIHIVQVLFLVFFKLPEGETNHSWPIENGIKYEWGFCSNWDIWMVDGR